MAKNLIGGNTTTIVENGNDIAVDLNEDYKDTVDSVGSVGSLETTDKTSIVNAINELVPYVLFDGTASTSSVDLSDSASGYSYLEIFYGWTGFSFGCSSVKIQAPTTHTANLTQTVVNNSYLYHAVSVWTISGTTITNTVGEYWRFGTSGNPTRTATNQIAIYYVVGYK